MPLPNWTYNELQQIGVDFASQTEVEAYDAKQESNSLKACQALLEKLEVGLEHTVIEFGTATGNLTIEAAKRCKHAYGIDVSEAMLRYARNKAVKQGVLNISFIHAGFLSYEHCGEPADFIITKFALHHLPDFWKMQALCQAADMLVDGGKLYLQDVIFSFKPQDAEAELERWISSIIQTSGFTREEFEMHVREEYSTYAWILEGMLERAGFTLLKRDYFTPTYAAYLCEKRKA